MDFANVNSPIAYLKLSLIYTVSLNMVFSIPQNQCYPGTSCSAMWQFFQWCNDINHPLVTEQEYLIEKYYYRHMKNNFVLYPWYLTFTETHTAPCNKNHSVETSYFWRNWNFSNKMCSPHKFVISTYIVRALCVRVSKVGADHNSLLNTIKIYKPSLSTLSNMDR